MSSSAVAKTSKYTYRSSGGAGHADVSIEYSADLSALTRLEVCFYLFIYLLFIIAHFLLVVSKKE